MTKHHRHHKLSTDDRIRGLRAALASPKTPSHLRPSLERQLEELQRGTGHRRPARRKSVKRNRSESKPAHKLMFDFLPF
jgi:hypothetical protein